MATFKFDIGDMVSLLSHPYFEGVESIIQSGDPLQQSPIMIVTESLEVKRSEKSTTQLSAMQYKCFWYSHKTTGFESAWISESLLKLFEKANEIIDTVPDPGSLLSFRTSHIELHKRKSSLLIDNNNNESTRSLQISSLLSFVPPLLMTVGYIRKDLKSGNTTEVKILKKEEYNYLKVSWFNYTHDKISEAILPVSCLKIIPEIPHDHIRNLQIIINNQQFANIAFDEYATVIKPISIHFLSGYYFLRAYDLLTGKEINNIPIAKLEIKKIYDNPVLEKAPIYNFKKGKKPLIYAEELIQKAIRKKKIIRIKYLSKNNVTSIRCLKDFSIYKFTEKKGKSSFLTGFCLSKMDTRHFNVKRISWIEMIDFKS